MAWLQKLAGAVWSALVALYATKTEWVVLFVILVIVEIAITPIYARPQVVALPRTIIGYVVSVVIFLAFLNAYTSLPELHLIMMASISMTQIANIIAKLGKDSTAAKVWCQLRQRIAEFLKMRLKDIEEHERQDLPRHDEAGDSPR